MASIRKTIRLNPEIKEEARILEYLNQVQENKVSSFVREALMMYIEYIEAGLYDCPYIGEIQEEQLVDRFSSLITQTHLGGFSSTMEDAFAEIDRKFDKIIEESMVFNDDSL